MKIFLVRHGETQPAANGVYGYSAPLTDLGHEQARCTGELLAGLNVTHIVSSDAVRAIQTAEPLCTSLKIDPEIIPDLKEIDIGRPSDGITQYKWPNPGDFVMDCSHQGGETWDVFRGRVVSALQVLTTRFEHDAVVAVFTHGGVKSIALDHYSGREISMRMKTLYDNGSVSTVEGNGTGYVVHRVNDVSHLASLVTTEPMSRS